MNQTQSVLEALRLKTDVVPHERLEALARCYECQGRLDTAYLVWALSLLSDARNDAVWSELRRFRASGVPTPEQAGAFKAWFVHPGIVDILALGDPETWSTDVLLRTTPTWVEIAESIARAGYAESASRLRGLAAGMALMRTGPVRTPDAEVRFRLFQVAEQALPLSDYHANAREDVAAYVLPARCRTAIDANQLFFALDDLRTIVDWTSQKPSPDNLLLASELGMSLLDAAYKNVSWDPRTGLLRPSAGPEQFVGHCISIQSKGDVPQTNESNPDESCANSLGYRPYGSLNPGEDSAEMAGTLGRYGSRVNARARKSIVAGHVDLAVKVFVFEVWENFWSLQLRAEELSTTAPGSLVKDLDLTIDETLLREAQAKIDSAPQSTQDSFWVAEKARSISIKIGEMIRHPKASRGGKAK
jgi:hypothetical protein